MCMHLSLCIIGAEKVSLPLLNFVRFLSIAIGCEQTERREKKKKERKGVKSGRARNGQKRGWWEDIAADYSPTVSTVSIDGEKMRAMDQKIDSRNPSFDFDDG